MAERRAGHGIARGVGVVLLVFAVLFLGLRLLGLDWGIVMLPGGPLWILVSGAVGLCLSLAH